MLPKSLVSYLVDLAPVVGATSYLYHDEQGDRVRDMAERLRGLVWTVIGLEELSPNGEG